jgi:hypothetical protein
MQKAPATEMMLTAKNLAKRDSLLLLDEEAKA